MLRVILTALASLMVTAGALAQTPVPFPRPGDPQRPAPQRPVAEPKEEPVAPLPAAPQATGEPSEATLGLPVYPGAQFLTSYDAGKGQRYFLFGTNAPFADIVNYYRTILKQRGDVVYTQPAIHMFDLARFREESMGFPPSITVKDYTWNGSAGYLKVAPGAEPARFRTVIQVVPPPPAAGR